jgi:hypothetical protein
MEALHAIAELGRLEDPLDLLPQDFLGAGDGHEVLGPSSDGGGGELDRGLARDDQDREVGSARLHRSQKIEGLVLGAEVADDEQAERGPPIQLVRQVGDGDGAGLHGVSRQQRRQLRA